MGVREAKRYISDLRRKQNDPYLWPDFLTGLPNAGAILKKVKEVYPKLGRYSVSYIRIANRHPYLIKYGPDRHSDIIQWAAAAIKTTAAKYDGFVGTVGTHDFVAICKKEHSEKLLDEASKIFKRKALTFYSKKDVDKKTVLSFKKNGETINVGLMKLIFSTVDAKTDIPKETLIPHLGSICTKLEME
jgi:GGDEF domain-containing protein